jgi:protein TonB
MLTVVITFFILQSWKVPHRVGRVTAFIPPDAHLTSIEIPKEKPIEIKHQIHKDVAQSSNVVPTIVKDDVKIDKPINDIDKLDTTLIGLNDIQGQAATNIVGETAEPVNANNQSATNITTNTPVNDNTPLPVAEIMPQFPGGKEAFLKFMQKNLRQPDDIEEGQKIIVVARFVVQADGTIANINITEGGRQDLDKEVLRVLNKMPNWQPGVQNGKRVAVYFKVPVTFMWGD